MTLQSQLARKNYKIPEKNRRAARIKVAWRRPALLRKAQNVVAVLFRIGLQSNMRWRASPASKSCIICAKICAKNLQNSGNPARPAHKNCVHSASVRYKYCTTSLRVSRVIIAFRSESNKRPASGSRKFCAQLARKICKIDAPRVQKLREVGQRCCAKRRTSLQFFSESVCNLI